MKEIIYKFQLKDDEAIEMELIETDCTEEIFYDTFANVFLNQENKRVLLSYDTLSDECVLLNASCKNVLINKYFLNEYQISDIGYTYNKSFYESVNSNTKNSSSKSLIKEIDKYTIWYPIVSMNNMRAWLYNNAVGEIILFIAPVYPFNFCSRRVKGYTPYNKWIKGYAPFAKRIVPREIAEQWLQQTEEIMALIEINSRPYLDKNK